MRTIVRGKNLEVPDRVRDYAERKLGRLERLLDDRTDAIVELSNEAHRSAADSHIADVTLVIDGRTLTSQAAGVELPGGDRRRSSTRSSARPSTTRRSRGSGRGPTEEKAHPAARSPTGPRSRDRERTDRQDEALRDRADVRGGRRRRDGGARPRLLRVRERRERAGRRPLPADGTATSASSSRSSAASTRHARSRARRTAGG